MKALGPAPVKIMARVEGSVDNRSNTALSSRAILTTARMKHQRVTWLSMGEKTSCVRYSESIELLRPIDLDDGHIILGKEDIKIFVCVACHFCIFPNVDKRESNV